MREISVGIASSTAFAAVASKIARASPRPSSRKSRIASDGPSTRQAVPSSETSNASLSSLSVRRHAHPGIRSSIPREGGMGLCRGSETIVRTL